MYTTTPTAGRVLVRHGFTESDIWRDALGGSEPAAGSMTHRGAELVQRGYAP